MLSRRQREWVAILSAWPAALAHESALPDEKDRTIHVAVGLGRQPVPPAGVEVHRTADFVARTDWWSVPARIEPEHALIDVMSKRIGNDDVAGAFAALARTLHARRTTATAVLTILGRRERVAGRSVIRSLLTDARDGACSVLERGYLHRVERAHGLPPGKRQRTSTATGKVTAEDVRYEEYGLVVELDGRGFHDRPEAWDADAARDLAALAATDARTARVTHGLVFGEECLTAARMGAVLRRLGWDGEVRSCGSCTPDARSAA